MVVSNLEIELRDVEQARARKDLLHGGLWCAGGVALTVADSGFIFWGAIIVGGIQFFKGLINLR